MRKKAGKKKKIEVNKKRLPKPTNNDITPQ